jgi:hypothetical protein
MCGLRIDGRDDDRIAHPRFHHFDDGIVSVTKLLRGGDAKAKCERYKEDTYFHSGASLNKVG